MKHRLASTLFSSLLCLSAAASTLTPALTTVVSAASTTPYAYTCQLSYPATGTVDITGQLNSQTGVPISLNLAFHIQNYDEMAMYTGSFQYPCVVDLGTNPITGQPLTIPGNLPYDQAVEINVDNLPRSLSLPLTPGTALATTTMMADTSSIPNFPLSQWTNWNSRLTQDNHIVLPYIMMFPSFKICSNAKVFKDEASIPGYGKDNVAMMAARGIITGEGNGDTFNPYGILNRAQACVMLARVHSGPEAAVVTDPNQPWYSAAQYNMMMFMGKGTDFRPMENITREQLCTVMRRMEYLENDIDQSVLNNYVDGNKVSSWAREGVAWGIKHGIIGQGSSLDPQGSVTRVQGATLIGRYLSNVYDFQGKVIG